MNFFYKQIFKYHKTFFDNILIFLNIYFSKYFKYLIIILLIIIKSKHFKGIDYRNLNI